MDLANGNVHDIVWIAIEFCQQTSYTGHPSYSNVLEAETM